MGTAKQRRVTYPVGVALALAAGLSVFAWINRPVASEVTNVASEVINVILLGWDGAQRDHLHEMLAAGKLPHLQRLINHGRLMDVEVTTGRTQTKPGWTEILTGYSPAVTGVQSNYQYRPIPRGYTIFERLKDHFGHEQIATLFVGGKINNIGGRGPHKICINCKSRYPDTYEKTRWWEEDTKAPPKRAGERRKFVEREGEPYYLTQDALDLYRVSLGPAPRVGPAVLQAIETHKDRRFFAFFHFEEPDELGHRYGENSEEYSQGLITADTWLGKIVSKLTALGIADETLIYVASDHGFDEGKRSHADAPYAFLATNDRHARWVRDRKDITPALLRRYGLVVEELSPPLRAPRRGVRWAGPPPQAGEHASKPEMRIGYFHGGRVFVPYRTYVFGGFDRAGLNVMFYTTTAATSPRTLIRVPKDVTEMAALREIDPNIGRFTGREILQFIMDGKLDGGSIGESSFIEAAARGLPIVAVAALGHDTWETKGKAMIVRKGSGINEPKDFIGKTIISRDAGPGDATFLREFFASIGVDPHDVNIVDYAHPEYMIGGLVKGEVDGGYYHHMTVARAVGRGLADIYQPFDWTNPELSQAVLVFRRDYYEAHQDEIKAFLGAYLDRLKYERDHPVKKWYRQGGVTERGLQAHLRFAGMDIPRFDYPPLIKLSLLNQMQDLLQKHRQVDYPPVDLEPYVDQRLLRELIHEQGITGASDGRHVQPVTRAGVRDD